MNASIGGRRLHHLPGICYTNSSRNLRQWRRHCVCFVSDNIGSEHDNSNDAIDVDIVTTEQLRGYCTGESAGCLRHCLWRVRLSSADVHDNHAIALTYVFEGVESVETNRFL